MKKRWISAVMIASALSLFHSQNTEAQQRGETKLNVNYTVASPAGSFKDFISKTTPRAGDVSILHGISDKLAIGAELGYRDFYEKYPRQIYKTSDGSDISAVISNSVQVTPLMVKAQYNLLSTGTVQPFLSAGAGISFVSFNQYLGEYTNIAVNKIGFTAQPAAGVNIPVGKAKRAGINVTAFYTFLPFDDNYAKNLNHAGAKVGISIPLEN